VREGLRLGSLATIARSTGGHSCRLAREICPREEFNALRDRLPRAVRRDVEPVPPGHVGLLVQAISGVDCPLITVYGHVRADDDPADAFAGMERRLRRLLA
jgi:hypothetical protein